MAVVVATRGRAKGCVRLVRAALKQSVPAGWALLVLVVDNNDEPGHVHLPNDPRVHLTHEPVAGIPDARNRGVSEALSREADVLAFIDDDEVPASDYWLEELVRPVVERVAEVTTGPARSRFDSGTPAWIRQQEVFNRKEHPNGSDPGVAYTNNCAVAASVFRQSSRWFDRSFRVTGGSDTEFFRRVHRSGSRICWISSAAVYEYVPPTRATVRWVLARSWRIGGNRVQFLRAERAPARRWAVYMVGSLFEIPLLAPALVSGFASKRVGLLLLSRASRGLGFLLALTGWRTRAYR